jgi:ATP-dependent exoDNAse (exonuclease V) beta subunit
MRFTPEQLAAIERRQGDLLLDAGAGSGKTSVLVERFVRAVREDGVDVGRVLAITFTDKAAAELRERIRARLRELGSEAEARDTEGAFISTIHGFCARVLRAHALAAGLDPSFSVLEAQAAEQLAGAAFDGALAEAARAAAGAELIAAHGPGVLRAASLAVHDELRARGQRRPQLPPVMAADVGAVGEARAAAVAAARDAARELGALDNPGVRVRQALDALQRVDDVLDGGAELWPGDLDAVCLPGLGGAAALKSDACEAYRAAVEVLRVAVTAGFAAAARNALNNLLTAFGERYARLKRERSAVDFEDLELIARELLARPEIGDRYRERFQHVMVDELQDTNRVQLELVDLLSGGGVGGEGRDGNLFMVGDAQQSIYGFRHADVELFEERGRALGERGARLSLQTNFRSRPEILAALNGVFAAVWGERFRPLVAGREPDAPATDPLSEMLIIDKGADWETEGLAAPWRVAEARVLAGRVAELIDSGERTAGEVVVLTRATTDLQVYERALEDAGVATYVIGGRGYWSHPQVVEMVSYLRALANPLDQESLYATLVSPLCGLSLDGLVLVAAGAATELSPADAVRLERFQAWFAAARVAAPRLGVKDLLERAMEASGYDEAVLAQPGGRRRLANVRKLMRLGREWEAQAGFDLRGFLIFIEQRAWGGSGGGGASGPGRESEAPVESEGLDAVRLMTIHRAKGLEFPVVCVADLGRGPTYRAELIRIGRQAAAVPGASGASGARLGLRLGRPGTAARIPALDYAVLGQEAVAANEAEERRLFYVAMTRARERLILSGAADLQGRSNRSSPIGWIAPAFGADISQPSSVPSLTTDLGVRITFVSETDAGRVSGRSGQKPSPRAPHPAPAGPPAPPEATASSPQTSSLSYSSLALHERCGYRFYVERVLGLPPTPAPPPATAAPPEATLSATDRGTLVHQTLQALDFRQPVAPADLPADVQPLVAAFLASDLRARLAATTHLRREQRFTFPLGDVLVTGTFDVLAELPDGGLLVVDYKTDRLNGQEPAAVAERHYAVQRLVYALAALHAGARRVEVVHLFLEAAERPVSHAFDAAETERLEAELAARAEPLLAGRFTVSPEPHRALCSGCPALGGLCSWPPEMSMRSAVDRLF